MKIISKQVKIKKCLFGDEIEKNLSKYGEPLRWAVVNTTDTDFIIEAVFICTE